MIVESVLITLRAESLAAKATSTASVDATAPSKPPFLPIIDLQGNIDA